MTQSVELAEGGKNVQFTDRTVPWMKLGKLTDKALTAEEAAKAGGLNFTVSLRNVYFTCDEVEKPDSDETEDYLAPECLRKMTNRKIVVRDDTLEPLSIVSSGYPVLQYHEAFDFMNVAVEKQDGADYVAAGSLKGGKQGFMVVRAPHSMQVDILDGKDPHEMFMVLRTSHDLTRAVEVMMMPLRGLCMNQLTLASFSSQVPHRWAVRHTSTMKDKLIEVQASLTKAGAYVHRYNELAKRLAAVSINDEQAKITLRTVIRKAPKSEDVIETIIQKWHNSPVVGWSGTGWGLVQAVSEQFDWGRSGGSPESRFLGALQGQTHKAINKTAQFILSRLAK